MVVGEESADSFAPVDLSVYVRWWRRPFEQLIVQPLGPMNDLEQPDGGSVLAIDEAHLDVLGLGAEPDGLRLMDEPELAEKRSWGPVVDELLLAAPFRPFRCSQ